MSSKIIFFDLETTGLDPLKHEIGEIAAVAVRSGDLSEVDVFHRRLKFNMDRADAEAIRLWYDEELWKNAVPARRALGDLQHFLRTHATTRRVSRQGNPYYVAQLAGHNAARFDGPFLREVWEREAGGFFPANFLVYDTLQLALWHDWKGKAPPNYKLGTLMEHLGVEVDEGERHTALYDVQGTVEVVRKLKPEGMS